MFFLDKYHKIIPHKIIIITTEVSFVINKYLSEEKRYTGDKIIAIIRRTCVSLYAQNFCKRSPIPLTINKHPHTIWRFGGLDKKKSNISKAPVINKKLRRARLLTK